MNDLALLSAKNYDTGTGMNRLVFSEERSFTQNGHKPPALPHFSSPVVKNTPGISYSYHTLYGTVSKQSTPYRYLYVLEIRTLCLQPTKLQYRYGPKENGNDCPESTQTNQPHNLSHACHCDAIMRAIVPWMLACCLSLGSLEALTFRTASKGGRRSLSQPLLLLFAKTNKRVPTAAAARGFGGVAVAACACGSGTVYNKCCGRLHQDATVYAAAAPEQVVRARYSAYARRVVDFIIASTHPDNKSFADDIEHWKRTIEDDCYDNFELNKCEILTSSCTDHEDTSTNDTATVQFLAHMTQRDTRERTSFIETSSFKRHAVTGAWLYLDGVIADPSSVAENDV